LKKQPGETLMRTAQKRNDYGSRSFIAVKKNMIMKKTVLVIVSALLLGSLAKVLRQHLCMPTILS